MKKFFFLMLSCSLLLGACALEHDPGGNDPDTRRKLIATSMHNANIGQIMVNLDPFNIAFRLNALMVESEAYGGDVNAEELKSLKTKLLGASTTITYDNEGVYTLKLQGQGEYDYLHTGTLKIHTGGSTLSNGNGWTLSIPEEAEYCFSMSGTTVTLYASNYSIASSADNTWTIRISKLISNQPDSEYYEAKSDWSGTITIKQDEFTDQTVESISKSTYTMEVESQQQITTMYVTDTMSVATIDPLRFSPACTQGQVVGQGRMRSSFTFSWSGPFDFTLSEWKGEGLECDPEIEVQYYGTVQE